MFELQGKNSKAIIYGKYPEEENAPEIGQIISLLNSPAITNPVRIMPDFHWGKGSCIGFTMKAGDLIVPNIVGVDIGCGMLSFRIETTAPMSDTLEKVDKIIRDAVPVGFNIRNEHVAEVDRLTLELAEKVGIDKGRLLNSIGTLGGGNHFIELGVDDRNRYWFTIHTGSRNFGLKVAEFYQRRAREFSISYKNIEKDLEFMPTDEYMEGMILAQRYAQLNRTHIMYAIERAFGLKIQDSINCIHNYINPQDGIIRKGAVAAYSNNTIILPFNRRDGIWIMNGLNNEEWNYSAPHGAGRKMSRTKAKKLLNSELVKEGLAKAGVYSSFDPIDEAPEAYKDSREIMDLSQPTAKLKFSIRPILNIKG